MRKRGVQWCYSRRGNVLVIVALLVPVLLGMTAVAVDISWLASCNRQLEVAADNCALAAANYIANHGVQSTPEGRQAVSLAAAIYGEEFMSENPVARIFANVAVQTGVAQVEPSGRLTGGFTPSSTDYDAVRVVADLSGAQALPSFFGAIFDHDSYVTSAVSIALLEISGEPATPFLPFAISRRSWRVHMNPAWTPTQDEWTWNYGAQNAVPQGPNPPVPDYVPEVIMYPESSIGNGGNGNGPATPCPGNFGALNINVPNNGSTGFVNQVENGVSDDDIQEAIGSPFDFALATEFYSDMNGQMHEFGLGSFDQDLFINGNPGLSFNAPLRDALDTRIGDLIGLFIYDECTLQGGNATFRIHEVRFGRLLGYQNGNPKWIAVQADNPEPDELTNGTIEVVGIGY